MRCCGSACYSPLTVLVWKHRRREVTMRRYAAVLLYGVATEAAAGCMVCGSRNGTPSAVC